VGFIENMSSAPGGHDDTIRQTQEAFVAAMAAAASAQVDAHRFVVESGESVLAGHPDVGEVHDADRGRDPDYYGSDASDAY
jgi:hypothetical protein